MTNNTENKQHRFFDVTNIKTNIEKRTARGGKITFGSQILIQLGQLAATMVLARKLGPHEYGLIAMITVVTGFISMFKEMGLSSATIQQEKITHNQISALFWINAILSLATAIVIAAAAPLLAWINGQPQLIPLTIALAIEPILAGCVTQHAALLQRQMHFGRLSLADIAGLIVGVTVAIISAYNGAGVWALVYMPLARQATRAIFIIAFCPWLPGLFKREKQITKLLRFGRNIIGTDLVNNAASRLDTFLIGASCGTNAVGIYSRAYQLLLLPIGQINIPFGRVAIPALSRLATTPEQYRKVFLSIYDKIILLGAPGIGLMIATADWIIRIVLGPEWDQAASIFAILGLAGLATLATNPTGWLFISQNRTGDMLRWTFISATTKLICIVVGLNWGLKGVTIAVVVAAYILLPLCLLYLCRTGPIRIKDTIPSLIRIAIFAAITYTTITLFRNLTNVSNPIIGLTSSILIATALTAAFYFISPKTKLDINKFNKE